MEDVLDLTRDWFARRTLHHGAFRDLAALARAKREGGLTVSVCIPTLNESATIGGIVSTIREELMERAPLVDEIAVMDSASTDGTAGIAAAAGAVVHQDGEILPELGPGGGKGDAMWKSLFVLRGELIVWIDGDVTDFDPRFVSGLLGPLLLDPSLVYVKAFYERPLRQGSEVMPSGGGRVTEMAARPMLNMFWPDLAGFVQPLSGESSGRRTVLEAVPFFTGYAVEIGLLIDIAERYGVGAMAQVDLERRSHRNREIGDLSRMSFAILRAIVARLQSTGKLELRTPVTESLQQFEKPAAGHVMTGSVVEVRERPPAASVPGYRSRG